MKILTARWVVPVSSPPLEHGAIAISGNTIAGVGTLNDLETQFPRSLVQDLGEAAILPGLINTHTHLELTLLRGRLEMTSFAPWIEELVRLKRERLTTEQLVSSARLGCIEAIRAGVTTVADTSEADAVLPALIESGQRGVVFQECFGPHPDQAADSIANLEKRLDLHRTRLDRAGVEARERLSTGISPHAPYTVSGNLYVRVAELAKQGGFDLALHAAESADEGRLLRDGKGAFAEGLRRRGIEWVAPGGSMIGYLEDLGVLERGPLLIHCVDVDDGDLEVMARNKARIAHCPKSNAKFGHGIAPLAAALRVGVRVGLGTDSVASNNNCDLIEEARFCGLLHRAKSEDAIELDADRLLRLMTIDGARALGLEEVTGSLETGKQADLIAIDLTHAHNTPHYDPTSSIVFSSSGRDCILTMVAGNTLFEGEEVLTIDEESALLEAVTISAQLR